MDALLTDEEVRVLGSLVEKQVTTPEYYPLTLNSLVNACNQISNRDPVVSFDEETVIFALDRLRDKKLAVVVHASGSRVPKYKHVMMDAFGFTTQEELAVMCVLMLRGAQTTGEIRGRAERLFSFRGLAEVEATLEKLMTRERPLVIRLARLTGHKEPRFAHTLAGEVQAEEREAASSLRAEAVARSGGEAGGRVARLEEEVAALRREVDELRLQLEEFRRQFE